MWEIANIDFVKNRFLSLIRKYNFNYSEENINTNDLLERSGMELEFSNINLETNKIENVPFNCKGIYKIQIGYYHKMIVVYFLRKYIIYGWHWENICSNNYYDLEKGVINYFNKIGLLNQDEMMIKDIIE